MKNKISFFTLIVTMVVVSLIACRKEAEDNVITRSSLLEGSQEVPAVTSTGSGKVEYSYNSNTKNLTYVATWANLNDSAISMHIHGLGVRGQAAPVFQNFTLAASQKRREGTYTGTLIIDNINIKEADLLGGKYYLNLHSKTNTGGELRAQLEF